MTAADLTRALRRLGACKEAREWASGMDLATVWATCPRSDWMLWLLDAIGYRDDSTLRLFACWCVRQEPCWSLLTDERSRTAVEVAERYAREEATADELSAASAAASAAAWAAASAAASAAAWAAWAAASVAASAAASAAARAAARAAASAADSAAAGAAAGAATWAATWAATSAADSAAARAADRAADSAAASVAASAAGAAARAAQADRLREVVPLAEVERLIEEAATNDHD